MRHGFMNMTFKKINSLRDGALKMNQNPDSRSKIKGFPNVFFYYYGVVHSELLWSGQTINKVNYLGIMICMKMFVIRDQIYGKQFLNFIP